MHQSAWKLSESIHEAVVKDKLAIRKVEELIVEATAAEDLPEPITRIGLIGRTLMVELAYILEPGAGDIYGEDRVRTALRDGLAALPYEPWIVVEFSYCRELVE